MSNYSGLLKISTVQFVNQAEDFPGFVDDEWNGNFSIRHKAAGPKSRAEESEGILNTGI